MDSKGMKFVVVPLTFTIEDSVIKTKKFLSLLQSKVDELENHINLKSVIPPAVPDNASILQSYDPPNFVLNEVLASLCLISPDMANAQFAGMWQLNV